MYDDSMRNGVLLSSSISSAAILLYSERTIERLRFSAAIPSVSNMQPKLKFRQPDQGCR